MENLGLNSKAVHRAYAKRALMKLPSLEEYELKNVETLKAESRDRQPAVGHHAENGDGIFRRLAERGSRAGGSATGQCANEVVRSGLGTILEFEDDRR